MKSNPLPARVARDARVSSDRQAEAGTIARQVDVVLQRAGVDGVTVEPALHCLDDGSSGSTLLRPQRQRLRDQAAAGALDRLYVLAPDRRARSFPLQDRLLEELQGAGVDVVFRNRPLGQSPADERLLQVPGVLAEYERAKSKDRARRGQQYAARQGRVGVLSHAPDGYRDVRTAEGGGAARCAVVLEEARLVQQVCRWVAPERLSLRAVCQRRERQGIPSRTGKRRWDASAIAFLLQHPTSIGAAH
jgi:site-specific DNA recombinase